MLYAIISQTESDITIKSIYTSRKKRNAEFEKIYKTDYEIDGVLYYKSNVVLNKDLKGE